MVCLGVGRLKSAEGEAGGEVEGEGGGEPGEADAEGGEEEVFGAGSEAWGKVAAEEGEGGRGGVAALAHEAGGFLRRQAEEAGNLADDEGVGLVEEEEVEVREGGVGAAEEVLDLLGDAGDGEVKDIGAGHCEGGGEGDLNGVAAGGGGEEVPGFGGFIARDEGGEGAIAKEHCGGGVGGVDEAREGVAAEDKDLGEGWVLEEVRGSEEAEEEAGAALVEVKGQTGFAEAEAVLEEGGGGRGARLGGLGDKEEQAHALGVKAPGGDEIARGGFGHRGGGLTWGGGGEGIDAGDFPEAGDLVSAKLGDEVFEGAAVGGEGAGERVEAQAGEGGEHG